MNTPRICAVIVSPDAEAIRQAEPLADLFELRLDLLGNTWESVATNIRKPWIATNRLKSEGGAWEGSEEARRNELLKAIKMGADIVDIELATPDLDQIVPQIKRGARCLISYHDMKDAPPYSKLQRIVEEELAAGADICKLVTTAHDADDNFNVLKLIKEFCKTQISAFAMGPHGQLSRILSPLFGGSFTYAALSEGNESASGQLSVAQIHHIYELMRP
ncbi:MAG: type I 3-dehydroquinate dehydratase [Dehalococcoidia bacterium]|nr:type I 3-dehydroquinate dehydratase [Dehalococcoidia bacterium]